MSAYMQSLTPVPLLHPPLRPMPSQSAKRISSATNSSSTTTFEFTRRKKWTDILFSELPDTVLFVLDFNRVIQYANPGASEALGWDVEEMVDMDVLKFINNNDKETFFRRFQDSLSRRQELFCYSRLKSKATFSNTSNTDRPTTPTHKELLFEIKGHALYLPEHVECNYFFFMAKPFPSRNMAALNTFLECKIENERLRLRLAELKALQHQRRIAASTASSSSAALNVVLSSSTPAGSVLTHVFGRVNMGEDGTMSPTILSASDFAAGDAEDEEGGRKKKLKKAHPIDGQHVCVTCGRTDSPEWRKGPKGPKTLCNACGLRWAKRARTKPEEGDPTTPSNGQGQGQTGEAHGGQGGPAKGQWPSPYTYVGTSPPTAGGRGARLEPMPNAALSVTPLISSAPGRKSAGRYNKQEQQQQQAGHLQTRPHQIQGNEHVTVYGHGQEYEQERHDHGTQGGPQHLPLTGHGGHGVGMSMHGVPSTPSSAQVSPIHGQGAHDFVYGGYGSGGQGGDGHAPGASNAGYLSSVSTIVSVDVRGLHPQQHYAESPTASAGYVSAQDRGPIYHEDGGSVHGGYSHALAQAAHWSAASGHGGNSSQHPPQHQQRGAYPGY